LIEASRQHVISTANLTLVWLYWNVGRVITQGVQKNQKRADYGEQLLQKLGAALRAKYGGGFSLRNLRDMRRFFECFEIRQPLSAEFEAATILPPVAAESTAGQIGYPSARKSKPPEIPQPVAVESSADQILSTLSGEFRPGSIRQTVSAESGERLTINSKIKIS
jgi:hypothetical protein